VICGDPYKLNAAVMPQHDTNAGPSEGLGGLAINHLERLSFLEKWQIVSLLNLLVIYVHSSLIEEW
jgi:hypothetical protein